TPSRRGFPATDASEPASAGAGGAGRGVSPTASLHASSATMERRESRTGEMLAFARGRERKVDPRVDGERLRAAVPSGLRHACGPRVARDVRPVSDVRSRYGAAGALGVVLPQEHEVLHVLSGAP